MNSLWFVLIIIVFIFLQSVLYRKFIFKNIMIQRSFENTSVFPGETVTFQFSVTNKKALPITWMGVDEKFPRELEFDRSTMTEEINDDFYIHKLVLSILPYQKVSRKYTIRAAKRGYYELREFTMTSTDLLGSQKYFAESVAPANISVFPNIRKLEGNLIPANTTSGDFFVNRWIIEDPMMIAGIRDYVPTDSLKSVNWKATAKHQKLQVNKYDYTADKKIMIFSYIEKLQHILDTQDIADTEKAIEVAASLALMLLDAGIPVGIANNSLCLGEGSTGILEPNTGEKHRYAILDVLAKMTYYRKYKADEFLDMLMKDISWGTEIIIVTAEVTETLLSSLGNIGNIRLTIVSMRRSRLDNIPANITLNYYCEEESAYEAV